MSKLRPSRHWFFLFLIISSLLIFVLTVCAVWALTDRRYRNFLTQQLSEVLAAEAIKIFLDVPSLLRGRFDFRHIIVTKPTLPVIEGVTREAISLRMRRQTILQEPFPRESGGWFTPRFTVQHLTGDDGTMTYRRATSAAPLFLTSFNASLVNAENGTVTVQLRASVVSAASLAPSLSTLARKGRTSHCPSSNGSGRGKSP